MQNGKYYFHLVIRLNLILFHSFAGRSKTAFLNASIASSGDWKL
ncbi:unnamed protein product [Acanthoscelides obtectus]|uniref:Uncharacterized protein n=1 Tax=Acanthoscelides obtectus TaxID=200917 RepID=A0A9P0PDZ7_ACAOB|nr:unnamed protein product [Acanthoscelides obtectus]CAK1620942.1 hypothetical protein AOBTE_LOCUS665 [Acanthoscelides obtectus]